MILRSNRPEQSLTFYQTLTRQDLPDGTHLVLAQGKARFRMWLRPMPGSDAGASFSIPDDAYALIRLAATQRFIQSSHRSTDQRSTLETGITRYQQIRLILLLRLLDGLNAGQAIRDLAALLVLPGRGVLTPASWRGSAEQRHVRRLIAQARLLTRSGFVGLLQGPARETGTRAQS